MTTTRAHPVATGAARFPLIVVDWAKDRQRYDSGWLRFVGPADLPDLDLTPTCQTWDGHGRPVTIFGLSAVVTTNAVDPAVRNLLVHWRSRVPVPVLPGSMSGDTAVPFLVDDVVSARNRLTAQGTTRRPGTWLRLLPIIGMLLSAAVLLPLLESDLLLAALAFIGYVVCASGMVRWSLPAVHWGDPPRRDPHDAISRLAVATKVVFWAVAGAAATLVALDWAEVLPGLFPWV